ncbi:MAG: leucyl aminopeptidase [Bacteroidales bacterium]|nr:leucyl aminopeptidase [Bacteroidales bacterium]
MKMRISKGKKTEANISRIVLVRKEQGLETFITDPGQKRYVEKRLSGDKDRVLLNQLDHVEIFVELDMKDAPTTRLEMARKAGFEAHPLLTDHEVASVSVVNGGVDQEECVAFAEGLALTNYQFLKYLSPEKAKQNALAEILLADDGLTDDQVVKLDNLVKAVYLTRDLVNEPLSYLTAIQLSAEIEEMGKEAGFSVEVFNKKKIEALKMGGLLAVNKGSIDPPTFSILTWKPAYAVNDHPIVLVGKGVVFDTGGLSLKPTHDSMDYMKCDMGGAAAVAGALYAVAKNGLPVWVVGLVPATDNRPDGNAYVPGDVVTMYDGTTVEVLNTDAEGRMLLADALSYAKQYDPELVIELSTLTGSAHMAIDKYGIVGMGNASREIMENLKASGEYTAERVAEFPFWDEYKEQLKSDIADLKNIGGKYGGAITAGKFLEHFTNYPYIHLDIAGPSFNKIPFKYHGKGGSGVGVRILYNFFLDRSN